MFEVDGIINDILKIEKRKIESLLSLCKSPIEKIYLSNFLKFYWENSLGIYQISFLHWGGGHFSTPNYPKETSRIVATLGSYIYGVLIEEKTLNTRLQIIPQYEVKSLSGIKYLDFAIFLECYFWKTKQIEKYKFFVECDGHEFHSSPEKIEKDNIRANELKADGWNEFRYSGRTINRSGFDAAQNIETFISEFLKPDNQLFD